MPPVAPLATGAAEPLAWLRAQFVAAAAILAQLHQIQVDDTPERTPLLLGTNWRGCGEATLGDVKGLLLRIGAPESRAALAQAPFSRLLAPTPGAAPSPPAPGVGSDCESAPTPDVRAVLRPPGVRTLAVRPEGSAGRRELG